MLAFSSRNETVNPYKVFPLRSEAKRREGLLALPQQSALLIKSSQMQSVSVSWRKFSQEKIQIQSGENSDPVFGENSDKSRLCVLERLYGVLL